MNSILGNHPMGKIIEKNITLKQLLQQLTNDNKKLQQSHEVILRLEKKNSVLAMIVTASHEINQPLSVLSGNVEILQMSLEKENISLNNQQLEMFVRAFESIDKIKDISMKYRRTKNISFGSYIENTEMVFFDGQDNEVRE